MDVNVMTKNVKFSVEANHPLCAKILAKARLLPEDSNLVHVIRARNVMKVDSSPNGVPCKINYQYFKRSQTHEGLDGERAFEFEFAYAVRDLLELNPEDYHRWNVTYKVEKRDIAYEPVVEFSVVFFNSRECMKAVESLGYPYNDGYVND